MKEAYKKRSRAHGAQESGLYDSRRRGRGGVGTRKDERYATRGRNRGAVGILSVVCALLALTVADYLINEGEILRAVRLGGSGTSGEAEPASSGREAAEGGGAVGEQATENSTPTVLLGEFFTDYAWDPDQGRQSNLRMASEAIDETWLAPGEEFSAIEVLEPLDYEPAKVFADGGVAYEEGGGLCQITSTLYMAASYAGLEITERNQHYAEVPYIKPGLDATVWFGADGTPALDMKFENNTDGDVLVREFVNEDGFLVAQIWGEEPTGKTVSMDSEKVEEDLGKGITWSTYKKGDGRERQGRRRRPPFREHLQLQPARSRGVQARDKRAAGLGLVGPDQHHQLERLKWRRCERGSAGSTAHGIGRRISALRRS